MGRTRKTTGIIWAISRLPPSSMSSRRAASRESAAWERRTSARGVPLSRAIAIASDRRATWGETTRCSRCARAVVSTVPARTSARASDSSSTSAPRPSATTRSMAATGPWPAPTTRARSSTTSGSCASMRARRRSTWRLSHQSRPAAPARAAGNEAAMRAGTLTGRTSARSMPPPRVAARPAPAHTSCWRRSSSYPSVPPARSRRRRTEAAEEPNRSRRRAEETRERSRAAQTVRASCVGAAERSRAEVRGRWWT